MIPDTTTEINNILDPEITPEVDTVTNTLPEKINTQLLVDAETKGREIKYLAQELSQVNDQFLTGIGKLLEEADKYRAEVASYRPQKQ
ncbi:hypothetical protein KKA50_02310 [Patescibacteria group bacterium]|nr:hypothetical protein [Patescibacteria group bacterium]